MTPGSGRRTRPLAALLVAFAVLAGACSGDDPVAAPTASTAPGLVVAALGDSFASGAGAPPYDPDSGGCQRSADSWPRRLDADSTGVVSVDHLACAGATTAHLTGGWSDRGLPAQIPAVPEPAVDLVTLVIGGNDLGFSLVVAACVFATCPSSDGAAFTEGLQALRTTLVATVYPALHTAYPNARIAHVGYPRLTPAPGQPVGGCGWLPPGDQVAAAAIIAALNDTIEASTAGQDVTYVDVTEALAGHELCTDEPWLRDVGEENQIHPDVDGQRAIEAVVARALDIAITP